MTARPVNLLSGRFAQMAYVTTNIEQALEVFAQQGVSEFVCAHDARFDIGGGREALCHVALAFSGGLQIEVIEPVGGAVEVYRAPFRGEQFQLHFHHQCHWVETMEEFASIRQAMRDRGYDIVIDGSSPQAVYFYADLRKQLGHFVEYVRFDPAIFSQLQASVPVN